MHARRPRPLCLRVAAALVVCSFLALPKLSTAQVPAPPGELVRRADAGDAAAMLELAAWYRDQDVPAAAEAEFIARQAHYLGRAAERGLPEAKRRYGLLLLQGDAGVRADPARGRSLLRDAAEGGDTIAQYRMGEMSRTGDGLARDPAQARRWFEQALAGGLREAAGPLGLLLLEAGERERAMGMLEQAARGGHGEARQVLVDEWIAERYVPGDASLGLIVLRRAASQKHLVAIARLGEIYLGGHVPGVGMLEGRRLLEEALDAGASEAGIVLAAHYLAEMEALRPQLEAQGAVDHLVVQWRHLERERVRHYALAAVHGSDQDRITAIERLTERKPFLGLLIAHPVVPGEAGPRYDSTPIADYSVALLRHQVRARGGAGSLPAWLREWSVATNARLAQAPQWDAYFDRITGELDSHWRQAQAKRREYR